MRFPVIKQEIFKGSRRCPDKGEDRENPVLILKPEIVLPYAG
jgi:hypothetical protein